MNLYKLLILVLCFFLFNYNFAQTSEGEIVISEESIQKLANKLYALKLQRNPIENKPTKINSELLLLKNLNKLVEHDTLSIEFLFKVIQENVKEDEFGKENIVKSDSLIKKSEKLSSETIDEQTNQDLQSIAEKLTSIENQLSELKKTKVDTVLKIVQSEPDKIIEKQSQVTEKVIEKESDVQYLDEAGIIAMQVAQNRKLNNVNTKIDSLMRIINWTKQDSLNAEQPGTFKIENDSINNQNMVYLRNQIEDLNAKLDRALDGNKDTKTVDNTKEVNPDLEAYEARKLKYGDYFKQIYFANNSSQIKTIYSAMISNLVTQLKNEPKIDVSIAGYASKTGNADYNQKISMERALALKTKLMEKSISPKRIITDFKGIDYDADSLEEARRLDIEFIIRK